MSKTTNKKRAQSKPKDSEPGNLVSRGSGLPDVLDVLDANDDKPSNDTEVDPLEDELVTLPLKDLFRIDEVADYFGVGSRTVRLWIAHGHLTAEKVVGVIRVSRNSILRCRFSGRAQGKII